ncbi:MAG: hypothetical protein KIT56_03640 [Gammaproteobacteria bacterium]|nr:hypothetical protein [Gammaproteobacteria bacterium]MCW5582968.1 hypothetical protein [Gammaproteobacteria bacterium]
MAIKNSLYVVGATRGSNKIIYRKQYTRKNGGFNRALLPNPIHYYTTQLSQLPIKTKSKWILVNCCFHQDRNPSLSINIESGHFKCFSCNAKGCDILAFHQLRYGFDFITAAKDLGAWGHG